MKLFQYNASDTIFEIRTCSLSGGTGIRNLPNLVAFIFDWLTASVFTSKQISFAYLLFITLLRYSASKKERILIKYPA